MRVLFLPDHTDGNPYQRNLAGELSAEGVDVFLASGYPLSTVRTILRSRPEVVHVHWIAPFLVTDNLAVSLVKSFLFVVATLVAKLLGIKVVWTVHNLLHHDRQHPRLELWVRRLYARLADGIIVHCSAAKESVMRRYRLSSGRKVFVVPHGHYGQNYPDTVGRECARDELGLTRDQVTFLYFGQIRPYKQVPRLIEAFSELETDAQLVIAGKATDKSEAQRIRDMSRDEPRIELKLGYVPDEDLQTYLNASDVLVLPHRDVLTSGSAILGMTFQKPVVGPRTGCLPELLDEQDELLYDPDTGSLTAAMRRALDAELAEIGQQNNRRVMAYEWDAISTKTREVYEGI
jgi:glycosyltransferase involved in cell wall biosynthesis